MEQQSEQNNQMACLNNETAPVSVGKILRSAREAAGLSLAEVTERLKLSPRQVGAIECDDFNALPGAIFVRGFVRNYARFLDLDPAPLMAALDQCLPSVTSMGGQARVENLIVDTPPQQFSAATNKRLVIWLIVLVIAIAVIGFWVFRFIGLGGYPDAWVDSSSGQMLAEQTKLAQPTEPSFDEPTMASSIVTSAPATVAASAQPTLPHAGSAAVSEQSRAPVAAVGEQSRLAINTTQLAWVSVTDAEGKRLIYSHIEPGQARQVSGTPPFKVILGNAENVAIQYNGQPVNFSDKIRNTTANIEIE